MANFEQTQINDLGTISEAQWGGTITATASDEVVAHVIERLDDYYIPVASQAPMRCIDGRPDPAADEAVLGPQVPGGTPGAALACHLAGGTAETLSAEAAEYIDACATQNIVPGDHRDEFNADLPTSGCGAIDKMDVALQAALNPQNEADIKRLTGAMLGENYQEADYLTVKARASQLLGRSAAYFENRASAIDYLEELHPGSAPVLRGLHNESFVIINTVPSTTLATNRFGKDFGIQAFGYDFWQTITVESGLIAEERRPLFIMARVVTAIATLMVLTDGSQRLIVRA